jgi:hypothetical protein
MSVGSAKADFNHYVCVAAGVVAGVFIENKLQVCKPISSALQNLVATKVEPKLEAELKAAENKAAHQK